MKKLLSKIVGDAGTKEVKRLSKKVDAINALEADLESSGDGVLLKKAEDLKALLTKNPDLMEKSIAPVFALTRELSKRILGMRHFDVQLIGGMVLHNGSIAEMRTGEGKTLVATLPVALNAMTSRGVHVVTVNDYLAQRDAGWMAPLYTALGLSLGVIVSQNGSYIYDPEFINDEHSDERMQHLKPCSRQEAYAADITYGTNNEFGFDYLRDNMVGEKSQLRQRPLSYAIVDEVDSILIDEARTPLIISAPSTDSGNSYKVFAQAVRSLKPEHYEVDEKQRNVSLNDEGVETIQKILKVENLYDPQNVQAVYHLEQALKAQTIFKRDKDYVVNDGEVVIVDEFTGRMMIGRRYSEGLHQAIEAKEGVEVLQESMTLATISFQNYFRLYDKLSGMTGTAATEKEEFYTIYKLDVIEIPTNKPIAREDLSDRIYKSELGKFKSIAKEVKMRQQKGQPVLIGTVSVEKNELLSMLLKKEGIKHELLNAKNNEREAAIVADAGQKGAVTLATNIAGRGTDIVLGEGVKKLGGLHVIGTERHESRRIDNQLRGRCGRQGDPGSTQFYVSLEDDLMRIFGGERVAGLMEKLGVDDETPIENKAVTRTLVGAQKKVENHNFDSRKNVVQYDDVMNRHRKATYGARHEILNNEDISERIGQSITEEVKLVITQTRLAQTEDKKTKEQKKSEQREAIIHRLSHIVPLAKKDQKKLSSADDIEFEKVAIEVVENIYSAREESFGAPTMRKIEREVYLQIMDNLWMQHLESMQHLREGISWRSIGQRDPLVEYRREGQAMYETMQDQLRLDVVRSMFVVRPRAELTDDEVETELTKLAEQASENSGGEEKRQSKTQEKRAKRASKSASTVVKKTPKDKKKQQRKNRKKGRK